MASGEKTVVQNRKAFHDFHIEERYEAGIVLKGSEVKALREGKAQIREAYGAIESGEVFLVNMHISPYSAVSTHEQVDPLRPRKLLLRHDEIDRITARVREKGLTVVPLRLYFKRGFAKVEIGLARGKKNYDRRRDIQARDAKREVDRALRRRNRGV